MGLVLDEGSSGSLLAYCLNCRAVVGVYDFAEGRVIYDGEPEDTPERAEPAEHPLLAWERSKDDSKKCLDVGRESCKLAGMTNTTKISHHHTHLGTFVIRLDDVRAGTVVEVGKSAIAPLAGKATIESMQSKQTGQGIRYLTVAIGYFAANDNEAARTARVFRSAIVPLVTGCTIASTRPI